MSSFSLFALPRMLKIQISASREMFLIERSVRQWIVPCKNGWMDYMNCTNSETLTRDMFELTIAMQVKSSHERRYVLLNRWMLVDCKSFS